MPGIPWQQFTVATGGWLLFGATVWLLIAAFVIGRIFSKTQVDEMIRPRDETIAFLREENKSLTQQNNALLRESVATQNKFFSELQSLKEDQP